MARETAARIADDLGIAADELCGTSVDIFHPRPGTLSRIMEQPQKLPHCEVVALGAQSLELTVLAIHDPDGRYLMPCVTWRVVTARVAREARTDSLLQMLDEMPINVMMADPKTFVIIYANCTTIGNLKHSCRSTRKIWSAPVSTFSINTPSTNERCCRIPIICRTARAFASATKRGAAEGVGDG